MTLKGSSKDAIIYFPEDVALSISDLGGNTSGKHDKIKIFLSQNQLNSIIESKKKTSKTPDAKNKNIALLLRLLFSSDENVFLNDVAYTILDSEIGEVMEPKKLYREEKRTGSSLKNQVQHRK